MILILSEKYYKTDTIHYIPADQIYLFIMHVKFK